MKHLEFSLDRNPFLEVGTVERCPQSCPRPPGRGAGLEEWPFYLAVYFVLLPRFQIREDRAQ